MRGEKHTHDSLLQSGIEGLLQRHHRERSLDRDFGALPTTGWGLQCPLEVGPERLEGLQPVVECFLLPRQLRSPHFLVGDACFTKGYAGYGSPRGSRARLYVSFMPCDLAYGGKS